ncbi:MAG: hypothetical protein RLN76_13550 [Phycisphaeraceae bacterium]
MNGQDLTFRSLYSDVQAVEQLKAQIARGRIWSRYAKELAQRNSWSPEDMTWVHFFVYRGDTYVGPPLKHRRYMYQVGSGQTRKPWS